MQNNPSNILVSYPKSGRTWIRYALQAFNIDLVATHAGTSTNWREIGSTYADTLPQLKSTPLIFLHRNPIDTAVSMYYQVHKVDLRRWSKRWIRMAFPLACKRVLPPIDINKFVLHPSYGVARICKFNSAWLNHLAQSSHSMSISYESMREDPVSGFQSIVDFYGIRSVTGCQLAELSTFENMRNAEISKKESKVLVNRHINIQDIGTLKVRKGIVGGYSSELSSETIRDCENIIKMHGFGQGGSG